MKKRLPIPSIRFYVYHENHLLFLLKKEFGEHNFRKYHIIYKFLTESQRLNKGKFSFNHFINHFVDEYKLFDKRTIASDLNKIIQSPIFTGKKNRKRYRKPLSLKQLREITDFSLKSKRLVYDSAHMHEDVAITYLTFSRKELYSKQSIYSLFLNKHITAIAEMPFYRKDTTVDEFSTLTNGRIASICMCSKGKVQNVLSKRFKYNKYIKIDKETFLASNRRNAKLINDGKKTQCEVVRQYRLECGEYLYIRLMGDKLVTSNKTTRIFKTKKNKEKYIQKIKRMENNECGFIRVMPDQLDDQNFLERCTLGTYGSSLAKEYKYDSEIEHEVIVDYNGDKLYKQNEDQHLSYIFFGKNSHKVLDAFIASCNIILHDLTKINSNVLNGFKILLKTKSIVKLSSIHNAVSYFDGFYYKNCFKQNTDDTWSRIDYLFRHFINFLKENNLYSALKTKSFYSVIQGVA